MASLNVRLFLLSMVVLPFSLWSLQYYQRRLAVRVKYSSMKRVDRPIASKI